MAKFSEGYTAARKVEGEIVAREVRSFGLRDSKGREIGYRVTIEREVYVADEESMWGVRDHLIGETFEVRPHALRDGAAFGAIPVRAEKRARTIEEALALVEPMFEKARKAAAKKAAA